MKAKLVKVQSLFQSIVGFLVLCTILIVTIGVVARLLKIPVAWTDEMLQIIFVWLTFIVAAVGFHSDNLISLDLVEDMLNKRILAKKILRFIQAIFGSVFSFFMIWQTYKILATDYVTKELTPVISFPVWLQSLGYFIGCAMFAVFAVYKIYNRVRAFSEREK